MAKKRPVTTRPGSLERYRVPILDRTLELVELLATEPDGLTLTAMTERLAMPKNAVFRIATTLTLREYAVRDEATKVYRLSRKLLSLGHAAMGGARLTQAAGPVLTALRDATGETALLGTLSGAQGVVLDQVASLHPVKVVVEVGHAFPLHTAAPAKAMLASLPPEASGRLVSGMDFKRLTRKTLQNAKAYLKELEEVRRLGWAYDRGEESETYACAAAAVYDRRGDMVAALWISGPADRVTAAALPRLGKVVAEHAATLSQKLGYVPV